MVFEDGFSTLKKFIMRAAASYFLEGPEYRPKVEFRISAVQMACTINRMTIRRKPF